MNNVVAQINAVPDCTALQVLVNNLTADMEAQIAAAIRQVEFTYTLAIPPTDLPSVIKWITAQIAPYLKQYNQAVALEVSLVTAYTTILAAISGKISKMNCTISVPSIPSIPTPPM
jgi:hypothetical protein